MNDNGNKFVSMAISIVLGVVIVGAVLIPILDSADDAGNGGGNTRSLASADGPAEDKVIGGYLLDLMIPTEEWDASKSVTFTMGSEGVTVSGDFYNGVISTSDDIVLFAGVASQGYYYINDAVMISDGALVDLRGQYYYPEPQSVTLEIIAFYNDNPYYGPEYMYGITLTVDTENIDNYAVNEMYLVSEEGKYGNFSADVKGGVGNDAFNCTIVEIPSPEGNTKGCVTDGLLNFFLGDVEVNIYVVVAEDGSVVCGQPRIPDGPSPEPTPEVH